MALEVALDFDLEGAVQHLLRGGQAELVKGAPRSLVFPFRVDLDYIVHRWRVLPLWPQGPRLIGFKRKNTLPISNPRSTTFGHSSSIEGHGELGHASRESDDRKACHERPHSQVCGQACGSTHKEVSAQIKQQNAAKEVQEGDFHAATILAG
jgi:hypothetical protein